MPGRETPAAPASPDGTIIPLVLRIELNQQTATDKRSSFWEVLAYVSKTMCVGRTLLSAALDLDLLLASAPQHQAHIKFKRDKSVRPTRMIDDVLRIIQTGVKQIRQFSRSNL